MSSTETSTSDRVDLVDGLGVLFRRWYVVVPALILTAIVTIAVNRDTTTRYEQTATVALTTPSVVLTRVEPTSGPGAPARRNVRTTSNALVDRGGTALIANLVTLQLESGEFRRSIAQQAPGASFTAGLIEREGSATSPLPVIELNVTAGTPAGAQQAMAALQGGTTTALRDVQAAAGVPTERYASSFVVRADTEAGAVQLSRARAAASVAVAGVVLTVALAAVVDAILVRRRRRPAGHHVPDAAG